MTQNVTDPSDIEVNEPSAGATASNGVTELWLRLCGVSASRARLLRRENPDPFDFQRAAAVEVTRQQDAALADVVALSHAPQEALG